jgi:hypothetical protein
MRHMRDDRCVRFQNILPTAAELYSTDGLKWPTPSKRCVLAVGVVRSVKHSQATRLELYAPTTVGISRSTVLAIQRPIPMFHHLFKRGGDGY